MLLKVDDEVLVISGGDKGHRGKVLVVDRKKNKVVVEGAGLVRKHVRRSQKNPQGGRLSKEMPIHASNVMVIDPQSGQPTRVGVRYLEDGTKERFAKKSGASLGRIAPPRDSYKNA
ncbi:MAG: 50S ribosomal protein L24 [Planctomycetota bacterium]